MVGFGSSLRMARRSGWERAYLDYETLKMLLSQIVSVYEEEGYQKGGRRKGKRDYRDELFLEDDSDLAFLSSDADEFDDETDVEEDVGRSNTRVHHGRGGGRGRTVNGGGLGIETRTTTRFSLAYSHEDPNAEDEDESDDLDATDCASSLYGGWGQKSSNSSAQSSHKKKGKRGQQPRTMRQSIDNGDDDYFPATHPQTHAAFVVEGEDGTAQETSSLLTASLHRSSFSNDGIGGSSGSQRGLYGFGSIESLGTPPQGNDQHPDDDMYGNTSGTVWGMVQNVDLMQPTLGVSIQPRGSVKAFAKSANTSLATGRKKKSSKEEERARKNRQRRKKRLQRKRAEREKRVPRHLRVAHSKARAIAERFLGLLRAEVEKVTLFAQSRLGELADTAGSLRFPSYDDSSEYGGSTSFATQLKNRSNSFEHPLSDGGMHPSASSSEDERAQARRRTGGGLFPWSDSDDDDSQSDVSGARTTNMSTGFISPMRQTFTNGGVTESTDQFSNLSREVIKEQTAKVDIKNPTFAAVQRQIAHFAALRRNRPLFQRMDSILGEDLLLLSAVDEADGYTAVGVELMHVLRYICVNVIAVRKICRKHDRLLMNRMLGGYYHRKRKSEGIQTVLFGALSSKTQATLGGVVSQSLGDGDNESNRMEGRNGNKLEGVYDVKIQDLANSNTVQVISNCIALALSEYEVTQSRADALAQLNSGSSGRTPPTVRIKSTTKDSSIPPPPNSASRDDGTCSPSSAAFGLSPSRWIPASRLSLSKTTEESTDAASDVSGGPPSTASHISLTRLRFTVVSIFAIREVARPKQDSYQTFLSRSSLVFLGPNTAGEGLDGCSREILSFFRDYCPDAALLLDSSALYKGLHPSWQDRPIGSMMLTVLGTGLVSSSPHERNKHHSDAMLLNAVSIDPQAVDPRPWPTRKKEIELEELQFGLYDSIDMPTLRLNRLSIFLYSMNYYLAHSTATAFAQSTGAHPAHSATIVGAASFGALVAAILQLRSVSKQSEGSSLASLSLDFYRGHFLSAASCAALGNIVHAIGVSQRSIWLSVLGRFFVGFGSVELLNKLILSNKVPPNKLVSESLHLMNWQLGGVVVGLMFGAFLALFDVDVSPFGQYVTTLTSFHTGSLFMASLWAVLWRQVYFRFRKSNDGAPISDGPEELDRDTFTFPSEQQMESDSSDEEGTPTSILYGSDGIRRTKENATYASNLEAAYGTKVERALTPIQDMSERETTMSLPAKDDAIPRRNTNDWKRFVRKVMKVSFYNVAIPVAMTAIVFSQSSKEILFSSCPLITNRYFDWKGSHAGLLLGLLSAFAVPVSALCGKISSVYDERTVIKHSIPLVFIGLLTMVNYGSVVNLMIHLSTLFKETSYRTYHPYDWIFGVFQYVAGLGLTFGAVAALEGTMLSLLSKVSPSSTNSVINGASIITILGLAGRVFGDLQILMVGLSHRLINTDIVNSLVIPMFLAMVLLAMIIRRNFFFLM